MSQILPLPAAISRWVAPLCVSTRAGIPLDVALLRIDFDFSMRLGEPVLDVLSERERSRAARFHRVEHAIRCAMTRVVPWFGGAGRRQRPLAPGRTRLAQDLALYRARWLSVIDGYAACLAWSDTPPSPSTVATKALA